MDRAKCNAWHSAKIGALSHKPKTNKVIDERYHGWNRDLPRVGHLRINKNLHANDISSEGHSNVIRNVPFGLLKYSGEIFSETYAIPRAIETFKYCLLTGKWAQCSNNGCPLLGIKLSSDSLILKCYNLFTGFRKLRLKSFNLYLPFIIYPLLFGDAVALSDFNQEIFSMPVLKSQNFSNNQKSEDGDARNFQPDMPNLDAIKRIPARIPTHDYSLIGVLTAVVVAFLVGFRVSNYINRRHLENLRRLWRK